MLLGKFRIRRDARVRSETRAPDCLPRDHAGQPVEFVLERRVQPS